MYTNLEHDHRTKRVRYLSAMRQDPHPSPAANAFAPLERKIIISYKSMWHEATEYRCRGKMKSFVFIFRFNARLSLALPVSRYNIVFWYVRYFPIITFQCGKDSGNIGRVYQIQSRCDSRRQQKVWAAHTHTPTQRMYISSENDDIHAFFQRKIHFMNFAEIFSPADECDDV